jgi:hypothetical protein
VPRTSDELLKAIAATTDAKAGRFGWGAPTTEHPNLYVEVATWVTGEGASCSRATSTTSPTRGDPAGRQVPRGREERAEGHVVEQARQLFIDGKVAMLRDGPG